MYASITYLLSITASVGTAYSAELLENGSFEIDGGKGSGPFPTAWDDAPGVGNDNGFGLAAYPQVSNGEVQFGGGFELPPRATDITFSGHLRPVGAGLYYGLGWGGWNGTGFEGSAKQIVEVAEHAGSPYEFSAWLASHHEDADYGTVTLEFFDERNASGRSLGSIVFDGNDQTSDYIVGSLDRDGLADPSIPATQDNWTLYRAIGIVPSTALSASVVIRAEVPGGAIGNGNDAYIDLVSLQVVPEPASISLACLLGALAMAWAARRRGRTHLMHRTPTTRYKT